MGCPYGTSLGCPYGVPMGFLWGVIMGCPYRALTRHRAGPSGREVPHSLWAGAEAVGHGAGAQQSVGHCGAQSVRRGGDGPPFPPPPPTATPPLSPTPHCHPPYCPHPLSPTTATPPLSSPHCPHPTTDSGRAPQVTVLFGGQNIPGSPFGVGVAMAHGDASKVSARGPGIEPSGNVANKPTYFDIYTAGGGAGRRSGLWGAALRGGTG